MKEKVEEKKVRVRRILAKLKRTYSDAECALNHTSPWELMVATILSAQCTDKRVNLVTPALFKRYRKVKDYAAAKPQELEALIKSTGFYKNKAKNIMGAAKAVEEKHGGEVPARLEELVELPGVGRKTANVVLGNAFGIPGITVDTHMIRINRLLSLTKNTDAVKIEFDLMPLVPKKDWTLYSHLIIQHGRNRCVARRADCKNCEIQKLCPSAKI